MSIYLYEESIVERLRKVLGDDRIYITPSDNIPNLIPRIAKDELKLPLVNIIRNNWRIYSKKSHAMKMNGAINNGFPMFDNGSNINSETGKIHRQHVIPITFVHTFEVWTRTRKENDEMIRELIWFFSTMGEFTVKIPYGLDTEHVFTLTLSDEIIDNTNILAQKDMGELFLQAIQTTCDDAYLWKSSQHNPICMDIGVQLKTPTAKIVKANDYNNLTIEEKRNRMENS